MRWMKARKKPLVIEFREVEGKEETIETREGTLKAYKDKDYILRGIKGEIYPCKKSIFHDSYELLGDQGA